MTQLMCVSISDLPIKVQSQGVPINTINDGLVDSHWSTFQKSALPRHFLYTIKHIHQPIFFIKRYGALFNEKKNIQEIVHISDLCVYTFIEHIAYHGTY